MRDDETREQYKKRLWEDSRKAFARHQIRKRGEGRWTLQERSPHPGGDAEGNKGWTWIMGAEIVHMGHRTLVVTGDIDLVAFAYGDTDPRSTIAWMGRHRDLNYIQEKAHIGMTSGKLVEAYESGIARTDIIGRMEDRLEELDLDEDPKAVVAKLLEDKTSILDDAHPDKEMCVWLGAYRYHTDEGQHELFDHLYTNGEVEFESEYIYEIGVVVAPRVFYAQAAVARLHELLTAEEKQNDERLSQGGFGLEGRAEPGVPG